MAARLLFRTVKTSVATKRQVLAYLPSEAIALAKAYALAPFDETVEIALNLLVDPKKGDQNVRGSCYLPHGLGKKVRLAVFTSEIYAQQAIEAGAALAGDALFAQVAKNVLNFDKVLATSEIMPQLKKFGKTLGPRGLMPSAKVGTVVDSLDMKEAIKKAVQGQVTFRVEEHGVLHAPVGKASFDPLHLLENYTAVVLEVNRLRPASLKGGFIESAFLKTTHGPAWRLLALGYDPSAKGSVLKT